MWSVKLYGQILWPIADIAYEPQAIPEWTDWQTCHGQTEVGNGIQGLFSISGWLHEFASKYSMTVQSNSPVFSHYNLYSISLFWWAWATHPVIL